MDINEILDQEEKEIKRKFDQTVELLITEKALIERVELARLNKGYDMELKLIDRIRKKLAE